MGKMKEIYEMVQDGTSELFIDAYKHALANSALGFTYNYKFYDMIKARAVVSLIKKAENEYEDYIESQAEMHNEFINEIARGK
mgnify:CR=1 FL=1|tara:strand:- start:927 stop:1175 length:249 start_codon:yes stop_codon:yes gene_type:complete